MFQAVDLEASEEDLRTAKADIARALTPAASGILLDPTFGVPAVTEPALAPGCGLLVAAEPSSRDSYNGEPRITETRNSTRAGSPNRAETP